MNEQPNLPAGNDSDEASGKERNWLQPRRMSNYMLWGTLAFFAILIAWAAFTKIDRTVHASGRVVPTAQLQRISNLEGGIVGRVLVSAGDKVREGQPLLRLDPTIAESDYSVGQSSLAALDAKIERLTAEVTGRQPRFANAQDPAVREQIEIERSLYRSRQADLASLTEASRARLLQAQRAVNEAEANRAAAVAGRDAARQQVDLLRPLVESGIEPQLSLLQAERQANVSSSQAIAATATISRARSSVAEAQAAMVQARQDWTATAGAELAAAQAEAASRREAQPALANRLDRTVVRSPLAGTVNRVLINTVGGTARPGEPLLEIVPSQSGLTIEAAVRPSDIAFVRAGQRSLVKITAYDYSIYGGMEGRVIGISPDAIVNEQTGEAFYTVRIRTESDTLLSPAGQRLPISSGMVADVSLIGDKRSILSYILTPFTRLQETAFRE
ncbi:HlyD family type I secretion periplasmic adaptor subunit [Qipengyuania spongiae]|uniref:Membrane fusion protein (MFP) family protein n=1 Tax=Qipengyuania spongiae TaxID=2909673 RepID=A0ABY5T292_9SPHN|nr:HlyD family type I secretion periplasmic adaptor subunit [Qipengyuania spongiae]UVI40867.1 HlyD family type I secretion periplasmic adaptor subunit [Qipengyuania spongiae]